MTNFSEELNTLYINRGKGLFEDVTQRAGLGSGFVPLGFGTKFYDIDNDGDLDIHVTNGHVIDNIKLYRPNLRTRRRTCCTRTTADGSSTSPRRAAPALQSERVGRGLAVADFDNNGTLDVAITSVGRAPVLLKNQAGDRQQLAPIRAQGRRAIVSAWAPRCEYSRRTARRFARSTTSQAISVPTTSGCTPVLVRPRSFSRSTCCGRAAPSRSLKDVAVNQALVVKEP